jgi:hypothetical protein
MVLNNLKKIILLVQIIKGKSKIKLKTILKILIKEANIN